ncbi:MULTISPECIES: HD domain-containing protein [unclassified Nocardiopsis]|uniref:HD domain-containing protein n=1 Tax=unclassified Nocardiopsis TaxID=2649073 RepID=UPI00135BFF40|nr:MULTISPECIES: HD domain-containing protein [unclassified Nocardiopsis]
MRIPGDDEIRALHERHAPTPEAFDLVYTHCRIVCAIAEQLLDRSAPELDRALVRAGCLLHDIGVYRLYDSSGGLDRARYVSHGVLGHRVLAEEGLPEPLCRFCSHHTGVGLTREDVRAQGLPIPEADYVAGSGEEELVMYADKFHSKRTPPVFVSADSYAASVARFGEDKVTRFKELRTRFGLPDLAALAAAYGHALV